MSDKNKVIFTRAELFDAMSAVSAPPLLKAVTDAHLGDKPKVSVGDVKQILANVDLSRDYYLKIDDQDTAMAFQAVGDKLLECIVDDEIYLDINSDTPKAQVVDVSGQTIEGLTTDTIMGATVLARETLNESVHNQSPMIGVFQRAGLKTPQKVIAAAESIQTYKALTV